ncbi:hypothetical protein L6164_033411 [Bauhinia variegata]|uniref:Uncharacterized protein n=1 Tax=Bauhinia variegata TaxID=167791 RepID=A0ACB9KRV6_BAUVA|nr:hypothetical protein L6164_033411 [Bauhinia variegata]
MMENTDCMIDSKIMETMLCSSWGEEKLSSMSKGASTISKYLRSVKSIVDELTMIDYPLDDIDLVLYYLSSLGPNYKDISTVLHAQPNPPSYDQIYE